MRPAILLLFALLATTALPAGPRAGAIYLDPAHPVYAWLERLHAKGFVPHAPLNARPWTRERVAAELAGIPPSDPMFTDVDRERRRYYLGEFADEIVVMGADSLLEDIEPAWWTVAAGRARGIRRPFATYKRDDAEARLIVAAGGFGSYDSSVTLGRHLEVGGWLRIGDHLTAQASMRDIAIAGDDVTPPERLGPATGWAYVDGDSGSTFSVDDPRALVTWGSRHATASVGIYPLVFGPGAHGQVIYSEKPPAVPQVRLAVHPWPWLTFTYAHLSLQSGVPDTTSAWSRHSGFEYSHLLKYWVAHRLEFTAVRGLDLAVGESIVYGARGPELAYLIPVVPFRAAQHDLGTLDNLQMWGDFALSRIPRTRLYGAILIDELSASAILRGDMLHNWWIWQLGALAVDCWGFLPDVDLRAEYVRANPWVYHHRYPWNTYDTWARRNSDAVVGWPLGFWQGHNGDFVRADVAWRPRRDIGAIVWASQARHGGDGTALDQYWPPTEPFLFGPVVRTREAGIATTWDVRRDLVLRASVSRTSRAADAEPDRSWTSVSAGFFWNVW